MQSFPCADNGNSFAGFVRNVFFVAWRDHSINSPIDNYFQCIYEPLLNNLFISGGIGDLQLGILF